MNQGMVLVLGKEPKEYQVNKTFIYNDKFHDLKSSYYVKTLWISNVTSPIHICEFLINEFKLHLMSLEGKPFQTDGTLCHVTCKYFI